MAAKHAAHAAASGLEAQRVLLEVARARRLARPAQRYSFAGVTAVVANGRLAEVATDAGGRLETTLQGLQRALPYAPYGTGKESVFHAVATSRNAMHDTAKLIPRVTPKEAKALFLKYYRREVGGARARVEVKQVDGYDDANFRVNVAGVGGGEGATYLLKCYNPLTADREFLTAQDAVTRHLAMGLGGCGVRVPLGVEARAPDLVPASAAAGIPFAFERFGMVRLQQWVEGRQLSENPFTARTAEDIGELCGLLAVAMRGLPRRAADILAQKKHPWDYSKAVDELLDMHTLIGDPAHRAQVHTVLSWYREGLASAGDAAPKRVIHGDVNWTNILLNDKGRVCGLCDFGDIQYTHRVNELATAVAYGVLARANHVAVARGIVRGYTRYAPLTPAERHLLPRAAAARIAQSLVMGAYSYSVNPGNEYLLETQRPGWDALAALVPAFMDPGADVLNVGRYHPEYDAVRAV